MNKPPLYNLPSGRRERRLATLRAIAVYLLALTALAWTLTQHIAWQLRFAPALGEPWLDAPPHQARLFLLLAAATALVAVICAFLPSLRTLAAPHLVLTGVLAALALGPLYSPAHLFHWAWQLRDIAELQPFIGPPIRLFLTIATGGGLVLAAVLVVRLHTHPRPDTHGSAHWAGHHEVEKAGLLGRRGLLLGLWQRNGRSRYLRHDGPEHLFVFAPTRTGKGVGVVLPNLLSWPGSVLVHDLKGENWALSAGWRRKALGSLCLRFDPTDDTGTAARYNPLAEIRLGPHEVRDAQNVADILVDPNGDRVRDHWDRTAHALLVGVILHVLHAETEKTLRGCAQLLSNPARPVEETLRAMLAAEHDTEGNHGWTDPATGASTQTHPVIAAAARALLDKAPNERSGVISTALSFLDLYRDPILAANTATSDFAIADLMQHERPVSLYLTVPASDLSRTRPLVRMLLNQALRRLTEHLAFVDGHPVAHYRHPLLLMLDEFPALGRLAFFQEALAFLAGYGIRACLIAQDLSQLYGVYSREEAITANCHLRVAFTANKPETAQLISRMVGDMTVHHEQRSYRAGSRPSVSQQQTRRPLLTPDEAMRLPEDDALVFVAGQAPVRATKIRYFEDAELQRRASVPSPGVSDVVRSLEKPGT